MSPGEWASIALVVTAGVFLVARLAWWIEDWMHGGGDA